MKFQRKFQYHLISVYIPSLSLFVISIATMRIDIEHFEATIMVHLTAMLVVYTLFQAISASLPQVIFLPYDKANKGTRCVKCKLFTVVLSSNLDAPISQVLLCLN